MSVPPKPQKRVSFALPNSPPPTRKATPTIPDKTPTSSVTHQRYGPKASPSRIIEYRSYQHDIQIYHFDTSAIASVRRFKHLLRTETYGNYGFIDMLIGEDTLKGLYVPAGDEAPLGKIEVGYLTSVLPVSVRSKGAVSGSAIGFRDGGQIFWFCFEGPVEDTLLAKWYCDPVTSTVFVCNFEDLTTRDDFIKVFEHVATMPKGITQRRVTGGNEEHRKWHDSLWKVSKEAAKPDKIKLKITYKGLARDQKAFHDKLRQDGIKLEEKDNYDLGESILHPKANVTASRKRATTD